MSSPSPARSARRCLRMASRVTGQDETMRVLDLSEMIVQTLDRDEAAAETHSDQA